MKVHVISRTTTGVIEVHRVGCADVAKTLRRNQDSSNWFEDVPEGHTAMEAVLSALNDSFGWTPQDDEPPPWDEASIHVFPCVHVEAKDG